MSRLPATYFGRALKKWRLEAVVSQEELAQRADVSIALVGSFERERGLVSTEGLANLCLGLESKLGQPMLATIFSEGLQALWSELLEHETRRRQERGWAAAGYESPGASLEDLNQAFDTAAAEIKRCALLWFCALDRRMKGWELSSLLSESPPETSPQRGGRVRIRKATIGTTRPRKRQTRR
jgi:transcriptional regulator with XRE-family HTH domain